jgi:hypothetical protein
MLSPLLGSCAVLGACVAGDGSLGPALGAAAVELQFLGLFDEAKHVSCSIYDRQDHARSSWARHRRRWSFPVSIRRPSWGAQKVHNARLHYQSVARHATDQVVYFSTRTRRMSGLARSVRYIQQHELCYRDFRQVIQQQSSQLDSCIRSHDGTNYVTRDRWQPLSRRISACRYWPPLSTGATGREVKQNPPKAEGSNPFGRAIFY